jgi:hypothetical protein
MGLLRMIITSNIPAPDVAPSAPPGTLLTAAIDVEWSKNYRICGGNVPFCYSVVWLALSREDVRPGSFGFWYTSAYAHGTGETGDLVASADSALLTTLERASLIAGHQLSSDLAILAAAASAPLLGVTAAQVAWRRRGQLLPGGPRLLDTRYDTGHVLRCPSRRLVDVCAELRLDVTQPELRGTSMTALHRRWLERQETSAREKVTVLNLRHALSTALVRPENGRNGPRLMLDRQGWRRRVGCGPGRMAAELAKILPAGLALVGRVVAQRQRRSWGVLQDGASGLERDFRVLVEDAGSVSSH